MQEAAEAIATMENELTLRRDTIGRLESKVMRIETSVETAHRRLSDLRQGAVSAKSIRREQELQVRLGHSGDFTGSAMDEAEALISQVMMRDDPFEKSEILREIDAGLNHETISQRMAAKGLGASTKTTAADVLARFN